MSNIVSMDKSCDYLVQRASVRRKKGNYDEAMTLLVKAKDQYGLCEAIEIEMARVYELIGCEDEATRAYLRAARLGGPYKAEALFQLALSSAQRGDYQRAQSYYEMFHASDRQGISEEYDRLLGEQLRRTSEQPHVVTRKGRAKALCQRGVMHIHAGKTVAARRCLEHALKLHQNAKTYTLLACCALLDGNSEKAIEHAKAAQSHAKGNIQPLLVLADAYAQLGKPQAARRALRLAAACAKDADDLSAAVIESAKRQDDWLTMRLTRRMLKMDPFDTRAMMIRGCALMNQGKMKAAARLFGRVCVLMPDNTISEALYHMARNEQQPCERLTLGMEVPYDEGVARASQLVAALYMSQEDLCSDPVRERMLCRYAEWAFRSQLAGDQVSVIALLVLRLMDSARSRNIIEDALTDPLVDDDLKYKMLQIVMECETFKPWRVDIGGRLVRFAAGGTTKRQCDHPLCRDIVQTAADRLSSFKDAPGKLLDLWLNYLDQFGVPRRKDAACCCAALEYVYHLKCGRMVPLESIVTDSAVSQRRCRLFIRRLMRLHQQS